ncbi:MAG: phage Gp37/Gp68 family protein [Bacteroidetes bacterium]|nr:phage Gp37/Gp68 family protein [Bacteroidota bacterium]
MSKSKISWTSDTWNPTTGCDKISAGCKNCYAENMSKRLKAMGQEKYKNGFKLTVHPESLNDPYMWKRPRLIFVNSMSDLFHKDVPIEFIQSVFNVMNNTPQHTYQILTKRTDLLSKYDSDGLLTWTDNIWMGVSVEDFDNTSRIDLLTNTGAKFKFLSCEPLLSPLPNMNLAGIDWVIVGGESGHGARKMDEEWILNIQKKCMKASIQFFFKQWGLKKYNPDAQDPTKDKKSPDYAKGGCMLQGQIHREMPISMQKVI